MTEQEAKEILELNRPFAYSELRNAVDIGIKALEEIQEYRAIGTPTQIYVKIGGLDVELGKYYSIGTVEELKFIKQWKADVVEGFCKYDASSIEELVENVRSKAIKDFVKEIRDWQTDIQDNEYDADKHDFVFERIYEIAEEMKHHGE